MNATYPSFFLLLDCCKNGYMPRGGFVTLSFGFMPTNKQ